MARPQKDGIDYFPLDVDFFSDKKIRILKARYGADGITIYLYLLCEIYRSGYYIHMDDDAVFVMSDELNMSPEKAKQVLNFLLERSLFDNTLFQSDKVLTSARIQKRFQLAVRERAKKTPIQVEGFWLLKKEDTQPFIKVTHFCGLSEKNKDNSGKNPDTSPELSLKESKVKESKEKNKYSSTVAYVADEQLNKAILDFMKHRENIKKPMSDLAVELMIKELKKISSDTDVQIGILHQSIVNRWVDVYPLKKSNMDNQKSNLKSRSKNRFHNFEQSPDYDPDAMMWQMLKDQEGTHEADT